MRNLLLSCFGMMPFLQRLLNRGVKPETPFQVARSVRILNGTATVLILNAIPFTIAGYLSGDVDIQKTNLIINAFTLLAGLTALYLSGIGKWKIGLHFISLFFMGFLLLLPILTRQYVGINLHYMVLISFALLLFDDNRSRVFYIILGSVMLFISSWMNSPANPFNIGFNPYIFSINLMLVVVLHTVITNSFRLESARYQHQIIEKNEELEQQKEEIETINNRLSAKNQQISDSIRSALRIQAAVLPGEEEMRQLLPEHFLLYKPKDIVSGDFYWVHHTNNVLMIAVGDCTGHGVPGAMMSMLSINSLEQIVIEKKVIAPDLILNEVNRVIRKVLKQDQTKNQDGFTLSLCCLDRRSGMLYISGAASPVLVIQNGDVIEIATDKYSIGGASNPDNITFTAHQLPAVPGTMIYLYSDGYKDQFGGPDNRKFMSRRFKELLAQVASLPVNQQEQQLKIALDHWMNVPERIPQTDDITVLGFKLL